MALTIVIIIVCYLLRVVVALAILAGINNGCIDDIPVGIAAFSWVVVAAVIVTGVFYIVVPNVNKLFMPLYNRFYKEFHK